MGDLAPTAANVLRQDGPFRDIVSGEAAVRGDVGYMKSDGKGWKAQNDGTADEANATFMFLADVAAGQTVRVQEGGRVSLGAIPLVLAEVYCVSATAGKICPYADVVNPKRRTIVGVAESTSILRLCFRASTAIVPA